MRFLVALAVAIVLIAGCGQKGVLYLRDSPPPGVKPPKPSAPKPIPYPEDTERQ
jgi:predicted small lipoprotein YifL